MEQEYQFPVFRKQMRGRDDFEKIRCQDGIIFQNQDLILILLDHVLVTAEVRKGTANLFRMEYATKPGQRALRIVHLFNILAA